MNIYFPIRPNTTSVIVDAITALVATLFFSSLENPVVSVVKRAMLPIGFTIAIIAINTDMV